MASAQTLHQPTGHQPTGLGHMARVLGHGVARALGGVANFFSLLHRANLAALEYDRLSHLSDEKLAAMNLTREDVGRKVIDRL